MATSSLQLFKAIQHDDQATVKRALHLNPALVHSKHPRHMHTPLHSAAAVGNLQLLKDLLQLGASCQACDSNSDTALHIAARQGHAAVVKELLTDAGKRSCLRYANRIGATPLHLAVAAGHTDVVQLLLKVGARKDVKDRDGHTPLDLVDTQNRELTEIMIQGRQLTPNSTGRTRRMISPGVSPTPLQGGSACTSPDKSAEGNQHQQQRHLDASINNSYINAQQEINMSAQCKRKAAADNMCDSIKHAPQDIGKDNQTDQTRQCEQEGQQAVNDDQQALHHTAQQSWLQFSPQRASSGACRQADQADMHATTGSSDALTGDLRQQQIALVHNMVTTPVSTDQALVQSTPQVRAQQQQKHSSQRRSVIAGPLHSARRQGPLSSAAAAHGLARSVDHLTPGGQSAIISNQTRQQEPDALLAGGASHIVSPEASAGLLGDMQHGCSNTHTTSGTSLRQQHNNLQQYDSFDSVSSGWQSCRRSQNHFGNRQQAQPQQHQQYAALSAAVSAKGRVGPLQLPVQSQLADLTSKVSQLEDWFQAQVELIPEWQKVLVVLQAVKRQVDDHKVQLDEVDTSIQGQCGSLEHMSAEVAALRSGQGNANDHISQLASGHQSMQGTLKELFNNICNLEAQLLEQASTTTARVCSSEDEVVAVRGDLLAALNRLTAVEGALQSIEIQLLKVQDAAACANHTVATDSNTVDVVSIPRARLEALESDVAVLRQMLVSVQQEAPAAKPQETCLAVASAAAMHAVLPQEGTAAPSSTAMPEPSMLAQEVYDLQQRVSDLSTSVFGVVSSGPLQGGAMEETILPFMETTSHCLQQHEEQINAIQAIVPKLEGVVSQRTQMCELVQQVSALQTAFNLLTGGKDACSGRSAACVLSSGPLSAQKAAADVLSMATNMVRLQTQMSALSESVEQMQLEWSNTAAAFKAESEAMRSAWEAERARMCASEREAVRRLAEQQKELKAREEKLMEIRESALAEEAARRSQLDSEARVAAALESMQEEQQLLQGSICNLTADVENIKEHVTALQDEVKDSLVRFEPTIAKVEELEKNAQDVESSRTIVTGTAAADSCSAAAVTVPDSGKLASHAAVSYTLDAAAAAATLDEPTAPGANPIEAVSLVSRSTVPDIKTRPQGVNIADYLQTQQQVAGIKETGEVIQVTDLVPDVPADLDAAVAGYGGTAAVSPSCLNDSTSSDCPGKEEPSKQTPLPASSTGLKPAGKVLKKFTWLGCSSRRERAADHVLTDSTNIKQETTTGMVDEVFATPLPDDSTTATGITAEVRHEGRWHKALQKLRSSRHSSKGV